MGKVYRFLGLSVGLIVHDLDADRAPERPIARDITYGTNNEFGFDYLRDNMVTYKEHMVQRELNFAIVDEVDSILIDEARTPLIISGAAKRVHRAVYARQSVCRSRSARVHAGQGRQVTQPGDYIKDEKEKTISLDRGGRCARPRRSSMSKT